MKPQLKDSGDRVPPIGMKNRVVEDRRSNYDKVRSSGGGCRQNTETPYNIMMTELAHNTRNQSGKGGVSMI